MLDSKRYNHKLFNQRRQSSQPKCVCLKKLVVQTKEKHKTYLKHIRRNRKKEVNTIRHYCMKNICIGLFIVKLDIHGFKDFWSYFPALFYKLQMELLCHSKFTEKKKPEIKIAVENENISSLVECCMDSLQLLNEGSTCFQSTVFLETFQKIQS